MEGQADKKVITIIGILTLVAVFLLVYPSWHQPQAPVRPAPQAQNTLPEVFSLYGSIRSLQPNGFDLSINDQIYHLSVSAETNFNFKDNSIKGSDGLTKVKVGDIALIETKDSIVGLAAGEARNVSISRFLGDPSNPNKDPFFTLPQDIFNASGRIKKMSATELVLSVENLMLSVDLTFVLTPQTIVNDSQKRTLTLKDLKLGQKVVIEAATSIRLPLPTVKYIKVLSP